MKVQAISNTNFRNYNNVNFSGKRGNNSQDSITDSIRSKAVAVPVIVMLAANPATLNSAIPSQYSEDNRIEAQAPETSDIESVYTEAFPSIDKVQQSDDPHGWPYLNKFFWIKDKVPTKTNYGDGVMLYAKNKLLDGERTENNASKVYIILNGEWTPTDDRIEPIRVNNLVYHNIGSESFYGVEVTLPLLNKDNVNDELGFKMMELKIDANSAKALYDFINDKAPYHQKASYGAPIRYKETTSPNLMQTREVRY